MDYDITDTGPGPIIAAFYRVEQFFAEQDTELLFGSGIPSSLFNDDALARTLEKISAAGAKKVFSAVALQALLKEETALKVLHADTTARLVYGAYNEPEGLNITRGYNKEHRSDLKTVPDRPGHHR